MKEMRRSGQTGGVARINTAIVNAAMPAAAETTLMNTIMMARRHRSLACCVLR